MNREQEVIAENKPQSDRYDEPTELLTIGDLAKRLRISIRQTRKLKAEGSLPNPIRLGRSIRWRASEIAEWIQANCPCRAVWENRAGSVRADG